MQLVNVINIVTISSQSYGIEKAIKRRERSKEPYRTHLTMSCLKNAKLQNAWEFVNFLSKFARVARSVRVIAF